MKLNRFKRALYTGIASLAIIAPMTISSINTVANASHVHHARSTRVAVSKLHYRQILRKRYCKRYHIRLPKNWKHMSDRQFSNYAVTASPVHRMAVRMQRQLRRDGYTKTQTDAMIIASYNYALVGRDISANQYINYGYKGTLAPAFTKENIRYGQAGYFGFNRRDTARLTRYAKRTHQNRTLLRTQLRFIHHENPRGVKRFKHFHGDLAHSYTKYMKSVLHRSQDSIIDQDILDLDMQSLRI